MTHLTALAEKVEGAEEQKRAFLTQNGWCETPSGWVRSGTFGNLIPLESAFHLETIIQSLDLDDDQMTSPAQAALPSNKSEK